MNDEDYNKNLWTILYESYMSITLLRENRGREAEIEAAARKYADEQMVMRGEQK